MAGVFTKVFNFCLFYFALLIVNSKVSAKVYRETERYVGRLLFCKYNMGLVKCILMCEGGQHHPSFSQERKQCCCYDAKEIHGNKRKIWRGLSNILFAGNSSDYDWILTKHATKKLLERIILHKKIKLTVETYFNKYEQIRRYLGFFHKYKKKKRYWKLYFLCCVNTGNMLKCLSRALRLIKNQLEINKLKWNKANINLFHINVLLLLNAFLCSVASESVKPKENIDMT